MQPTAASADTLTKNRRIRSSQTSDAPRAVAAPVQATASAKKFAKERRTEHEKANRRMHAMRFLMIVGALLVFLVLALIILYPNAKTYYGAWRDYQNLSAELTAVDARNDIIQTENDVLGTDEGVEDRAREEFGWVKSGENAVNVTGIVADEANSSLPDTIVSGSVVADTNWFIDELDVFFGYEYQG
jgi:cell division protein FtsB